MKCLHTGGIQLAMKQSIRTASLFLWATFMTGTTPGFSQIPPGDLPLTDVESTCRMRASFSEPSGSPVQVQSGEQIVWSVRIANVDSTRCVRNRVDLMRLPGQHSEDEITAALANGTVAEQRGSAIVGPLPVGTAQSVFYPDGIDPLTDGDFTYFVEFAPLSGTDQQTEIDVKHVRVTRSLQISVCDLLIEILQPADDPITARPTERIEWAIDVHNVGGRNCAPNTMTLLRAEGPLTIREIESLDRSRIRAERRGDAHVAALAPSETSQVMYRDVIERGTDGKSFTYWVQFEREFDSEGLKGSRIEMRQLLVGTSSSRTAR